ncbi:hypothetical protein EUX98_g2279 [Antrodiella citrinella]|uniref:Uncharacterized protein n=1 Tax=Antrodiella citrinella TaxID=2447956 RepID=A0A4S4N2A7_9APHY|nr:hypothetical protein EUX98_g2279 [Antrodiella citrinella]
MLTSMQTQSTFPFAHFGSAALVHLTDTNIAFNSLNLANLMVLTIDNSRSSLPNLMNLISVLREAPALGSLTVTGRCMSDPAEELDILRNDQVVPLQNLVKIDLRTEAVFVREFFSVVSVPATSQIHLHVRKPAGSDEVDTGLNLEDAFPDENRFHHLGCLKSTKILTLTLESGAQPFLLCFDDVTSGSLCIYPALADITRDPTHWQVLIDDCVDAIEHLAIKKGVVTLSLRDDPLGHLSTLNLAFLFNSIPNLRILVVKARHVDSVLDALKLYSQGREVVVCPELVAIRFEDLTVDGDVVTHIVECFETRRDSGSGVRVLDLSAAGGCEAEHLEILERACQQVLV